MGMHVKAGRILVGAVEAATEPSLLARPVEGSAARFEFNPGLEDAPGLADLSQRFQQHMSTLDVACLGVVQTRSYGNWKYADAYTRVMALAAAMHAANELGLETVTYTTDSIAKTVGVPAAQLQTLGADRFGLQKAPTYWTTGLAEAFAAAAHALRLKGTA
ncbi:MAG TPA: hypothetical protein VGN48_16825 [Pedococcus sp.]|nr:hypothetical protein [Pedococcus sp.]